MSFLLNLVNPLWLVIIVLFLALVILFVLHFKHSAKLNALLTAATTPSSSVFGELKTLLSDYHKAIQDVDTAGAKLKEFVMKIKFEFEGSKDELQTLLAGISKLPGEVVTAVETLLPVEEDDSDVGSTAAPADTGTSVDKTAPADAAVQDTTPAAVDTTTATPALS